VTVGTAPEAFIYNGSVTWAAISKLKVQIGIPLRPRCYRYYQLVTMEDGLFFSYLLSRQSDVGVLRIEGKMLHPFPRARLGMLQWPL
jgi:hypothetical protein